MGEGYRRPLANWLLNYPTGLRHKPLSLVDLFFASPKTSQTKSIGLDSQLVLLAFATVAWQHQLINLTLLQSTGWTSLWNLEGFQSVLLCVRMSSRDTVLSNVLLCLIAHQASRKICHIIFTHTKLLTRVSVMRGQGYAACKVKTNYAKHYHICTTTTTFVCCFGTLMKLWDAMTGLSYARQEDGRVWEQKPLSIQGMFGIRVALRSHNQSVICAQQPMHFYDLNTLCLLLHHTHSRAF